MVTSNDSNLQTSHKQKFLLRELLWSVYVPAFLLGMGQWILVPILPMIARDQFGAGDAMVGVAISSYYLGTMIFDIPAGLLVGRYGLRNTMLGGILLFSIAAIFAAISPNMFAFLIARVFSGFSYALWGISRHTYITRHVPSENRGKALSLFGGISRLSAVVSPILGGLLAQHLNFQAPFFIQAIIGMVTLIIVLYAFSTYKEINQRESQNMIPVLTGTLSRNTKIFMTAGLAAVLLQFIRAARWVILPLWGDNLGLSPAEIGYIIGASSAVDAVMFPIVGFVMDKWGRKYTGIPAFILLAASFILLPFTSGFSGLMFSGMLAGIGNGLSSGFVLTLGADLAPSKNTGEFLGVWRFISDAGGASGPIVVGGIAQIVTLGIASISTSGLSLVGALIIWVFVSETLIKKTSNKTLN